MERIRASLAGRGGGHRGSCLRVGLSHGIQPGEGPSRRQEAPSIEGPVADSP